MYKHASLNRCYRHVWSEATNSWHVVAEITKGSGKGSGRSAASVVSVVASFVLSCGSYLAHAQQATPANSLPTAGVVSRGAATISQTSTAQAARLTVNQTSQRAVVNWSTFNVGQNAIVNFVQPNAQAVTLNKIADQNPSQIFGQIQANGQVLLINPNGIFFSPTSQVDVGALVATTHNITDDDFMAGKSAFSRNGATGKIVNEGSLNSALGSYIALLAPEVQNAGMVIARAGTVVMASGEVITLNFDGNNSLAGISTTASTIATLIENRQAVQAPDGQIILSAVALDKLQAGVIKNSGRLVASSLSNNGGQIVLEADEITLANGSQISATGPTGGGTVLVGGDWHGSGNLQQATKVVMEAGATIDASATNHGDGGKVVLWSDIHSANSVTYVAGGIKAEGGIQGGSGGQVETSGHVLQIASTADVSTKSNLNGVSGTWLLDPVDITITGDGSPDSLLGAQVDVNTNALPTQSTTNINTKYTPSASNNSFIDANTLNTALSKGNVFITTGLPNSVIGTDTGNITVLGNIVLPSTAQYVTSGPVISPFLQLEAAGEIKGSGSIAVSASFSNVAFRQYGNSTGSGFSGVISGAGGFQKYGTGTLILSGNNTFAGGVSIYEGTLKLGASGTGTAGPLGSNAGPMAATSVFASGTLDLNGYSSEDSLSLFLGSTLKNSASVPVTNSGAKINFYNVPGGMASSTTPASIVSDIGREITLSGYVIGTGPWTKDGTGTLTIAGTNTSTSTVGAATVNSGTLDVTGGLADSTPLTVASNATYSVSASDTIGSIAGAGSISIGAGKILTTGASASTTFSGVMSGGGSFTKAGTGTLTLSGVNTYAGTTTVSAGALDVTGSLADTTTLTAASGATYLVNASDTIGSLAGAGSVAIGSGQTLTKSDNTLSTFSGVMSGSGSFTVSGGTQILTGTNTYTGSTTISSGATLQIGSGGTTGALASSTSILDDGTLTFNLSSSPTVANAISGAGSIHNDGTGSTLLTGILSNAAASVVNAGALCIGVCVSSFSISAQTTQVQVQAITNSQINGLSTSDIQSLTTTQIGYFTNSQINQFSTSQLAAMTTAQVAAMTTTQVAALTSTQLGAVTAAQMAAMTTAQVAAMTTTQVAALTSTQLGAMTTNQLGALTTAQVAALTSLQLAALTSAQQGALLSNNSSNSSSQATQAAEQAVAQISAQVAVQGRTQGVVSSNAALANPMNSIAPSQMAVMSPTQMSGLNASQVQSISPAQMSVMSPQQLSGFMPSQIGDLSNVQVQAITPTQLSSLPAQFVSALKPSQMSALTPNQVQSFTPAQVASLVSPQLESLPAAVVTGMLVSGSFTPSQVKSLSISTVAAMSDVTIASLPASVVESLTVTQLQAMSPSQVQAFTDSQVNALSPQQKVAIGLNSSIPSSTAQSQVSQFNQTQIAALKPQQLKTLSEAQISSLSPTQLQAMSGKQLAVLSSSQLQSLNLKQVQLLQPQQLSALPVKQIAAFSSTQLGAMNRQQVIALMRDRANLLNASQSALAPSQKLAVNEVLSATVNTGNAVTLNARNGVLPVAVVGSTTTGVGVRFDGQGASSVKLQMADAPPTITVSPSRLNASYTTVQAHNASNELVTFRAAIVGDRLVLAPRSASARQMAKTDLPNVLSSAIDTLGSNKTIAIDSLKGVVLNMR